MYIFHRVYFLNLRRMISFYVVGSKSFSFSYIQFYTFTCFESMHYTCTICIPVSFFETNAIQYRAKNIPFITFLSIYYGA